MIKPVRNIFLTFAVLTYAAIAHAYIPHSSTIANRLTRTHGKGFYAIEQEVQFRTSSEPLILRERWIVENGESMRVSVTAPNAARTGDPTHYEVVYTDGRRSVTDPIGGIKVLAESPEFLESFLHARSGRTFLSDLVRAKIVPLAFMKERVRAVKVEQIKHVPEPLVRLGRTSGVVAWIFGEPSPVEGRTNPEAWIEQDSFLLRRLRFPSEAEVAADRYASYSGALKLPRERTVTWDNNSVTVRIVSVKPVAAGAAQKSLDPASLNSVKNARLPDLAQVREFYSRFR